MRLRESADCTGHALAAVCTCEGACRYRRSQASRETRGKMISTMAQLKNCCLGGLKAGTEREGNNDLVVDFNPLFPLLYILTNYLYLEILIIQSFLIR
jgi:hypothetical protein